MTSSRTSGGAASTMNRDQALPGATFKSCVAQVT